MTPLTKSITLSFLLCTTATVAFAQDDTPFDLGTIRIETTGAQSVLGNNEISEEEIEERNAATVADVFKGETSITASGGAPIAQKVFVNGVEESLLSVTIDGARQNKSAFHHAGNVLIDPALLKSVEVSAGLAPADAGPNALAGSIAYTTKDARDLLEEGDNFGGLYSLSGGTNGTGYRSSLSLFGREKNFEFLLHGTVASGDDYEDGDGNTIMGTEIETTDYVAKFAYASDAGKRLSFSASETTDDGLRTAQAGPGGIFFIRPDFGGVNDTENVLVEGLSKRTSFTLTYTDEAPEGWFAPTAQLSYNEQELDASGVYGVNKSLSGVFKNEFELANGTVNAGIDFFDESAEGLGRGPGAFASSGKEELQNIGLFVQARQDVSERVSVSYGARFDVAEFTGADGSEFSDNGFSLNASTDVILTDQLTLNAGIASSWGGYELGEAALVNFGGDWTYDGFTTSRATAARLGLRYEAGPWAISGAIFDTKVDDINSVLPGDDSRGGIANLRSRGFDGSVAYRTGRGFAALNYTYADVEVDEDTAGTTAYYLGRPVGHIIGFEAGYDVNDEWRLGGDAQFVLKNTDTAIELPAYEVVNIYAEYKPQNIDNLKLRVDIDNLFDETYASRSSDGLGSTRVIQLNQPGRTISLTASVAF